ncbi:MAG: substrate-binding domain-containing protein [Acetobacteraceae bacterium]
MNETSSPALKGSSIRMLATAIVVASATLALAPAAANADDAFVQSAKKFVASVTSPAIPWTGPTSGPKAVPGMSVIYVSTDQRNGGPRGAGLAAAEAAKVIGWKFRILDGQGTVSGQNSALSQAIALKPNGIILGGVDAVQSAPLVTRAEKAGIKVVGWHAGPKAGAMTNPEVFWNVSTDPAEVSKAAALYAVATSDGRAGVVIFTDSEYALAIAKSNAMADWIRKCSGCRILATEDTPLGQTQSRMPQLTTSLLERFGKSWTYSLGINDLYYDFMGPSLQAAGIPGDGHPWNISGGDGSASAFQRIRSQQYQVATVAEPLHLQGWQLIDELNRAFAGDPPSGFVDPVHLFIHANIGADGGPKNVFDPANGYQAEYRKIWGN